MSTLVLIPARLASTRLPGKPLSDIAGKPMVVRVAEQAAAANLGRVVVAVDAQQTFDVVSAHGFEAVMTDVGHESGSDRIYQALNIVDPNGRTETVVNVQGDLPTVEPRIIRAAVDLLRDPAVDIGTLGVVITREEERRNENVVKIVGSPLEEERLRALYFTRATAPWGDGPLYHHVGLYAYRRAALERFVSLQPSTLERRERLEQLRALEAGMRIDAAIVDAVPLGVDTAEDLERARHLLSRNNQP
ncbi:3-deoxy-manno-octulosonate cytidylyltransferase [Tianweitania sediminis]|jgi:3-deoxy-manno-octulosonate cytidylyltransferase (CMP-KDO synthetase)|uniref:3-deoxy-manno-octulosonate cytidylyltransferase n=1 Tax=Tianweitania sediminis TaxID=1502156 RepID=A0A8J7RHC1_9HYPH|nr:3-deoxy-manno-octulosonate cytidylyltransferase [Tianweitania sediminis]MBP0438461.1 3-deoxy-manno-octulosonate cytidylyltransferase [Tianweitania sediminis]HEV7417925.1 3-deoxy-manno-octulosonate cytidylyltransferase [Tianweitania sediminis]